MSKRQIEASIIAKAKLIFGRGWEPYDKHSALELDMIKHDKYQRKLMEMLSSNGALEVNMESKGSRLKDEKGAYEADSLGHTTQQKKHQKRPLIALGMLLIIINCVPKCFIPSWQTISDMVCEPF